MMASPEQYIGKAVKMDQSFMPIAERFLKQIQASFTK